MISSAWSAWTYGLSRYETIIHIDADTGLKVPGTRFDPRNFLEAVGVAMRSVLHAGRMCLKLIIELFHALPLSPSFCLELLSRPKRTLPAEAEYLYVDLHSFRNVVLAEQVQQSVEGINFLTSGYSILATAEEGVVLAAGVWDRDATEETTTVRRVYGGG